MSRDPVFNPLDESLFDVQRQQIDWMMLQNGFIFRYDSQFSLDSARKELSELGYLVHSFDAREWTNLDDMHKAFAQELSFPSYYGKNLDALNDVLSDVAAYRYGSDPSTAGTVLAISGYDTVIGIDHHTAELVLDIFSRTARLAALFAHPMLFLAETSHADFGKVGGLAVEQGPTWSSPSTSSPPWPIRPSEIIEVRFSISQTDPDTLKSLINTTLNDILGTSAKWQVIGPTWRKRDPETRDEIDPRQSEMEVTIGLQGEGDVTAIDDGLYDAFTAAGILVGRTTTSGYPDGDEREQLLMKYPELGE